MSTAALQPTAARAQASPSIPARQRTAFELRIPTSGCNGKPMHYG